jgi:hypothetical protein
MDFTTVKLPPLPLAFFLVYTRMSRSPRRGEDTSSRLASQCEREMDYIPLLREKAAEHIGKNTPHRCPVWGGDDTHCRAAPTKKDAPEL